MPYLATLSSIQRTLCHEQYCQQEAGVTGEPWKSSAPLMNLNSKRKVGADHTERELGAEKGQGAIFRAWAGNDHPGLTNGGAKWG